jgi:hypothetical protein
VTYTWRGGGTVKLWLAASAPICSSAIALTVCRQPWTKDDVRLCDQDGVAPDPPDKCLYQAAGVAVRRDGVQTGVDCSWVKAFVFRCIGRCSADATRTVRFRVTSGKWVATVSKG